MTDLGLTLDDLRRRWPEMTRRFDIPFEVEGLDDGWYFVASSAIHRRHAEGETAAKVLDELQNVAHILLELQVEDGNQLPEHLSPPDGAKLRLRAQIPGALD